MRVAPSLCQAYKGVTASDLYERYHGEGGQSRLELDLAVAAEMADQVNAAVSEAKGKRDAKGMVSRRNQRRQAAAQVVSDDEALQLLNDAGIID